MDRFVLDLRVACRALARTPGFTATAVLVLALGIGANVVVFAAVDAILLRPLPFPDGDRLVQLTQHDARGFETTVAPVRLDAWQQQSTTFDAITGYYVEDVSEVSGELPEKVRRASVAPRFIQVWGITPALGRGFTAAEHRFGGPAAAIISERFWRRRFAADPHVLERTIRTGTATIPIVGVTPASFAFPDRDVDLFVPVQTDAPFAQSRTATWYTGIGRLKPGASIVQAREDLTQIQAGLGRAFPQTDAGVRATLLPLKDVTVGPIRSALWLLFGAVSVLLLIACTNIAALVLSRVAQRSPETAIRMSLGATRPALAMQLLTEVGVLAGLGGIGGVILAAAALAGLRVLAPAAVPRIDEVAVDGRFLLYALASTIIVCLACGVLPSIGGARRARFETASSGRTVVAAGHRAQWLLVAIQIALSVVLLAAAGLLVRSLYELTRVDPGFDADHLLTFRMSGSYAESVDMGRVRARITGTLEALRGMSGVADAATAFSLPGLPTQFEIAYDVVEAGASDPSPRAAQQRVVSPSYFATLGVPITAGDLCRPGQIMVNGAFARRFLAAWPSAVGLHLRVSGTGILPATIVGVVGNVHEQGLDRAAGPVAYVCDSAPVPAPFFLVRTRQDPDVLTAAIRLRMKALEPLRAVFDIAPLTARFADNVARTRLQMQLIAGFATAALLLACVGLYGTLSYVVHLRRPEAGLRLALGASRMGILVQFVGRAVRVATGACVAGLVLALLLSRALSGMLFGVSPTDPLTLAGVASVALAVAAIAAAIPAARAARIDPAQALRGE